MTTIQFDIDLGCLGMRAVVIEGRLDKDITGKPYIEITKVLINVRGQNLDLLPFIGEEQLRAMRYKLVNNNWSQLMHGREAAGEVVA